MFTINIKGKENPKDLKMVKLEMIIFKTGYAHVTKVFNISGPLKDWDNQSQSFKGNNSTLISKNKILFDLRNQYQKVVEDWDLPISIAYILSFSKKDFVFFVSLYFFIKRCNKSRIGIPQIFGFRNLPLEELLSLKIKYLDVRLILGIPLM